MDLLGRLERFERLEPLERAAFAASPAPMVGQILSQPLIPGAVDLANRAQLRVLTTMTFDQHHHAEIDAGEVWIRAEVIANHDKTFRLELGKRLFHLFLAYMRARKRRD
jgi:hypothetical protein